MKGSAKVGENTKIEWATHTFNPWVGCTKVSPACDHCYAEGWAKRTGQGRLWEGERRRTSMSNWQKVRKWDREAAAAGRRDRVFCASLADVFDNQVPPAWRRELWHYIEQTPSLDWLLLTKRPQNIAKMLPDPETGVKPWGDGWANVWLGTTAENQVEANRRIPHLLAIPAQVRFLSCEPLLEMIDVSPFMWPVCPWWKGRYPSYQAAKAAGAECGFKRQSLVSAHAQFIDWVICGGESGPGARPMHPAWARSLRDQCAAAGVAFHFKQWGEWVTEYQSPMDATMPAAGCIRAWGAGDQTCAWRLGKKAAGRLLDGREHNDVPGVTP